MPTLSFHIFLRVLIATGVTLVALVLLGWLTQVIALIDFVIVNERSVFEFVGVTMLLVPLIVALAMPTALFVATIFVLDQMNSDSELAVLSAAGVSRWRLLRPFLGACVAAVLVSLFASLVMQPAAMGTLRAKKTEIRADLMTTLINEGQFSSPRRGMMIHVKDRSDDGRLTGIIFRDTRQANRPVAYLAREAQMFEKDEDVFLLLSDGTVIRGRENQPNVDLVHFEQYTLNLSSLFGKFGSPNLTPEELHLGELINPPDEPAYEHFDRSDLYAEAHARLSNPLYCLVAMLVAFAALCDPRTTRRSRVWLIVWATVIVAAIRIGGIMLASTAEHSGLFVLALYAVPVFAAAATLAYLVLRDGGLGARAVPLDAGGDTPGYMVRST